MWVCGALIALNLIVFAPLRNHEFINYDDSDYVTENPPVLRGLTWQGVSWAMTTGHAANWHPLTWLSHMLDIQLFGLDAGAHHVMNLVFHIANSLLLFGLLYWMTGMPGRCAFVAALFAVHPLHVESVAWVAERKDVLSMLFGLLTMWAYVAYVRRPGAARYLLVLALFALGLMSKPMLVTLPFVLLLLDFWPLGRMAAGPTRLVYEKLPLLALVAASSIVTFVVQQQGGAVTRLPLNVRVGNAVLSYVAYIGKMLWPADLGVFYPLSTSATGPWVLPAFLALAAGTLAVIRAARRYPYLAVGWLWYLGTLVPVIGLVQVGSQSMADRYTYLPLVGLFIMAAWGIPDLVAGWPYRRVALPAAAAVVVLCCAVVARGQVGHWRNAVALWEHTLEVTTANSLAHNDLGVVLAKQGKFSDAIVHYSEALRINPNYPTAHHNLGLALTNEGRPEEAARELLAAIRLEPNNAEAHNDRGRALAKQGDFAGATAEYSEAVRINPAFAEAHNNLGVALARQGRGSEAILQYSEAIRIKPDLAEAHNNLAAALAEAGRIDEAIRESLEALRIKPDEGAWHYNVGLMFTTKGDTAEATRHFETALKLNPRDPRPRRALDELAARDRRLATGAR